MKKGANIQAIIEDQVFMRRLADANRIKNNKSIVDHDAYFHRVYGYLPDDLPSFVGGVRNGITR